jgi:hypothetical protein
VYPQMEPTTTAATKMSRRLDMLIMMGADDDTMTLIWSPLAPSACSVLPI